MIIEQFQRGIISSLKSIERWDEIKEKGTTKDWSRNIRIIEREMSPCMIFDENAEGCSVRKGKGYIEKKETDWLSDYQFEMFKNDVAKRYKRVAYGCINCNNQGYIINKRMVTMKGDILTKVEICHCQN